MRKHVLFGALAASLVAVLLAGGCNGGLQTKVETKEMIDVAAVTHNAVDRLLSSSRASLPRGSKVLVATFVDLNDVTSASELGRVMGDAGSCRLTQRGFDVTNLRLRDDSVAITPDGEFFLSRDVSQLRQDYHGAVVLVGTYARTRMDTQLKSVNIRMEDADPYYDSRKDLVRRFEQVQDNLYVSLRLISTSDNSQLAAYDFRLTCDEGINSLLGGSEIRYGD